jgi:dTMP kinase
MSGLFITMEGIDGCGKSTQIKLLASALGNRGLDLVVTREPGGTPLGEAIRGLLSSDVSNSIAATTELFLIVGARAQHVTEVIKPALEAGKTVISDRYTDSTVAFQGHGRGLDLDRIARMNELATGGLRPDLTLVFDLDPRLVRSRPRPKSAGGLLGAFDDEQLDFHDRVRRGYRDMASKDPGRLKLVDAGGSVESTHAEVLRLVDPLLSGLITENREPKAVN